MVNLWLCVQQVVRSLQQTNALLLRQTQAASRAELELKTRSEQYQVREVGAPRLLAPTAPALFPHTNAKSTSFGGGVLSSCLSLMLCPVSSPPYQLFWMATPHRKSFLCLLNSDAENISSKVLFLSMIFKNQCNAILKFLLSTAFQDKITVLKKHKLIPNFLVLPWKLEMIQIL